jgi:hypothetical protein
MVKCTCPNCKYVRKIEKLIPDKELCKKVMDVTEGLFCAMEDTIHDLQYKLTQCHNKNTELKGDIARRIDASKD